MSASQRNKGKRSELDVARYLENADWTAKRRLSGNGQAGDLLIADAPHVVIDVKDRAEPRISDWLDQLDAEADGRPHQCLVWKPFSKGADPGAWLALVANYPHAMFQREIARPRTLAVPSLTTPVLRSMVGWFDIEHHGLTVGWPPPALYWQDWLIMRFSVFADEVLCRWEVPS